MDSGNLGLVFGSLQGPSVAHQLDGIDLAYLLQEAGEAVVYVDAGWVVRFCNDVYLSNVRLPRHQVLGHTPFEYSPHFGRSIFYEAIEQCRQNRKPTAKIGYSTVLNRWLLVRVFPAGSGTMMLANDASQSVVRQVQLAQRAVKDDLTGLANKIGLIHDLETLLPGDQPFTLALIGLDRFRAINDALGYAGGDLGLMEVGSRMQTATLDGERVYRLAGDEFALLSRAASEPARQRVAELLRVASQPLEIQGHRFTLGATAGCVERKHGCSEPEHALKLAALALQHAKKSQRGGVVTYEQGLESASQLRAQLEDELRKAIDSRELQLHLQPKGSLSDGRLVGAEALLRWPHPKRGMVPPGEFLPLAQECGIMRSIDQLVLGLALEAIRELQAHGVPVPVSINLSVDSLTDRCLLDRIDEALRRAGVPPQLLEIEIPEGALMHNVETATTVLAGLDAMGIRISIDDFGTGYSSFAYLARFPVHAMKIDRSFVADMTTNPANQKIVRSLVRLAHSLQIHVVAEGAETEPQIEMLAKLKCDQVQGYGYARPMPLGRFLAFAKARLAHPTLSAYTL